jgi:hypothetical protein
VRKNLHLIGLLLEYSMPVPQPFPIKHASDIFLKNGANGSARPWDTFCSAGFPAQGWQITAQEFGTATHHRRHYCREAESEARREGGQGFSLHTSAGVDAPVIGAAAEAVCSWRWKRGEIQIVFYFPSVFVYCAVHV